MKRGHALWLGALVVGLFVALALRTERPPRSVSAPHAASSSTPRSRGEAEEFEIEVADPSETRAKPGSTVLARSGNESELVRALAASWEKEPERALALAEAGELELGESPRAVERRLFEIKALVKLGRIGSARTRAERYLAAYPPGPMTDEVERLTGVHRRPEPEKSP